MADAVNMGISLLAIFQAVAATSVNHTDTQQREAVIQAAANGKSTFRLHGDSLTMVNGRPSKENDAACSVNLAYAKTGAFVTKWSGVILDDTKAPKTFYIPDCALLPKDIFLGKTSEQPVLN